MEEEEPIEDGNANMIEYEYGKDFQDYMNEDGERLPQDSIVGVEYYDIDEKKIVFKLLSGIYYADEAWNEME